MRFEDLGLHADILKGISDAGFVHCTPIQEQSLPECIAGKDVIAQSQTGTGKTAVFLLTIFSRLMASGPDGGPGRPKGPRGLVVVPTRELAAQVIDDSVKLGKHLALKSVAIYGGVEYDKQIQALKGGVDLVVATPGRMIDLHKSKTLSLDSIEIFVIDEADRMFDMGFAPDIMYIAGRLPKKPRQTMLFSATIDSNVRRLASRYMKPDPVMIEIEPEQVTVDSIDQKVIYVSNEEKLPVLLALLKRSAVERSIIFTNMKSTAERVGWKLTGNGIPAKVLTGDLSQERRQRVIEGMKAGKIKTLVATDVAARGLHIEDVTHVINYDLPDDAANYVHRIGRTARAGKSGQAYSLVCEDHALNLPEIEKYIERKIESEWIEDSEMVADKAPQYRDRPAPSGQRAGQKGPRHGEGRKGAKHAPKDGGGQRRHAHGEHKRPEAQAPQTQKPAAPSATEAGAPGQNEKKHQGRPGEAQRPPRRHGRRRFEAGKNEPGRHAHKENKPEHKPEEKTHRPRPHHRAEKTEPHSQRQGFTPVALKPEPRHQPPAEHEQKQAGSAKKPGILKRLIGFIKKS